MNKKQKESILNAELRVLFNIKLHIEELIKITNIDLYHVLNEEDNNETM